MDQSKETIQNLLPLDFLAFRLTLEFVKACCYGSITALSAHISLWSGADSVTYYRRGKVPPGTYSLLALVRTLSH